MGAVSRFSREGLSRFDRDVMRKGLCARGAEPGSEPFKNPAPVRFQFPRRPPLKLKTFRARLRRSLTGAERGFSVYFGAFIPTNSRLGVLPERLSGQFKVHRIRAGRSMTKITKLAFTEMPLFYLSTSSSWALPPKGTRKRKA
jgi:hypothetical protein